MIDNHGKDKHDKLREKLRHAEEWTKRLGCAFVALWVLAIFLAIALVVTVISATWIYVL